MPSWRALARHRRAIPVSSRLRASGGWPDRPAWRTTDEPYPQAVILVQGFADTTGSEATNQGLSEARARAVAATLAAKGIASSRLEVQGYGTASAAESNATAKGRGRNRRVEVTVR